MEMKSNVVILYASQYSMKDENGRPMEGVSAAYIIGDNLAPVMHPNGALGCRPARGSLPLVCWSQLTKVPALYSGTFDMTVGSDGKAVMKLVDVQYVSEVYLDLVGEGAQKK